MKKDAYSWLAAKAVRTVTGRVDPARLLRCRFVLTWKRDEAQPDGKKPKARLVVLGFADPDIERLRSEAPVASRRADSIFWPCGPASGWRAHKADAVTAFLQRDRRKNDEGFFCEPTKGSRGNGSR